MPYQIDQKIASSVLPSLGIQCTDHCCDEDDDARFHKEQGIEWDPDEIQSKDQFGFHGKLRYQTIEELSRAIQNNDDDRLTNFIGNASKFMLNDITIYGTTLASKAAGNGDVGLLNWILDNQKEIGWDPGYWLRVEPLSGNTLAHSAIADESLKSLNWILDNTNRINWTKEHWRALVSNKETLAHEAALWGCSRSLDWILFHQDDIEWKCEYWKTVNDEGQTFVDLAIEWENEDVLSWAIDHQEDTQLKIKKKVISCFLKIKKSRTSNLRRSIFTREPLPYTFV